MDVDRPVLTPAETAPATAVLKPVSRSVLKPVESAEADEEE
jgi:hypothetical protein